MPLIRVASLSQVPEGGVIEVTAGEATYALCNVEGTLHCVEGTCPHAGGPLGEGALHGNYVVCPWHGWEFDCRTGLNDADGDLQVQTFPVVVQGDDVLIEAP